MIFFENGINMKKVIVFGATGYIGAYFVDYCKSKFFSDEYQVVAAGRRKTNFFDSIDVEYINIDIRNQEDFERLPKEDVYAVVNLAGLLPAYLSNYNPLDYVETNVKGALHILEYARKTSADRVLYSQTWAEQAGYWGVADVLSPEMPRKLLYVGDHAFYAITKSMVAETMEHYKQQYGIKNFVFRLPNVYMYSPEKYYYVDCVKKLVAYRYMIDRVCSGLDIEMWGNPNAFKDILYIKDLCQLMYKALFVNIAGGTYNAGTGIRTTLREQIEGIIDVFSNGSRKSNIIERPEKKSFTSFVMNIDNAVLDLGYEPEYTYIEYLLDYKKEQELKRFDSLWGQK